jgi:SAM-dependent methyltransferase
MFGVAPASFPEETRRLIDSLNFRYRVIEGDEFEQLVLRILHRIESDRQIVGAPERKKRWEEGWRENLDAFRESGFSEESLVPKFIRRGQPLRLNQAYVCGEDPDFELNFVRVLRNWLACDYLSGMDEIHEFGCGTGFNLLAIADMFPAKRYFGSDFVAPSVELVNAIAREKNIGLVGRIFDMKAPDHSYELGPKSGVFTFGSIEQLAGDIDPMFEFLLSKEPGVCLHVEPAEELYDLNNLSDFLAHKFQSRRKYTSGLLKKLRDLESQGRIEVLKVKRLFFGSLFMEGYNLFVWRKKGV